MQELRLVLIIVGALAIAALLAHGLWTSKKEKKSKFSAESLSSDDMNDNLATPDDDFEIIKKSRKDPAFGVERAFDNDPLDSVSIGDDSDHSAPIVAENDPFDEDDLPTVKLDGDDTVLEDDIIFSDGDVELVSKPRKVVQAVAEQVAPETVEEQSEPEEQAEPEMEVIVLHVHCSGEDSFVGTKLFDSMQQNGLIYGEMDIFHRHADLSGNGKVLFSVANMMQPGTLQHDDPDIFTTKGISFFMTLPCFGDADQNFKLMLRTAQQIADDLGANVLDDQRNFLTPDKLTSYREKIRTFKSENAAQNS